MLAPSNCYSKDKSQGLTQASGVSQHQYGERHRQVGLYKLYNGISIWSQYTHWMYLCQDKRSLLQHG